VVVKICDMGNGCWTHHHFTPEIQTRQYRSPEVIIGADYNTSADVWSFACTIFEMVTGEFLFEPRKGNNYDKDDDHLAQMMELLGRMPRNLALSGKNSRKFFNAGGHLKRIKGLNYWPLKSVLNEKYYIKEDEAAALADFLLPMLRWNHEERASAEEMLRHPWLDTPGASDFKLTTRQIESMSLKKDVAPKSGEEKDDREMNELIDSDPEIYAADTEDSYGKSKKRSNRERFRQEMQARGNTATMPGVLSGSQATDQAIFGDLCDETEVSLLDADEERALMAAWKEKQAKIHNSFTGPYPPDPTEFNHNDKGENYQFSTVTGN
jgi:serine/threonine protein kinase